MADRAGRFEKTLRSLTGDERYDSNLSAAHRLVANAKKNLDTAFLYVDRAFRE